MACDASCMTCHDSSLCLTCKTGYYNGTDQNNALCQACPATCATCTSAASCQSCLSGNRLDGSTCIACPSNCATCSAGGCLSCDSGYSLISAACPACTDVGNGGSAGCLTCESVINSIKCKSCADGYYLTPSATCALCTSKYPNSALCTNDALIQCQDDFHNTLSSRYYKIGNQCIANTNNCKTMVDQTGTCSQCYFESGAYYRLNGGVCT